MDRLSRVPIFVAVARHGSFAEAARRLGMTGSAVSKQVQRLEMISVSDYSIEQPVSSVSLTKAHSFLSAQHPWLKESKRWVKCSLVGKRSQRGSLRISAPVALAQRVLKEPLTSFVSHHPGINLHVELSDRFVDLVGEGFDLAIRIGHLRIPLWLLVGYQMFRWFLLVHRFYWLSMGHQLLLTISLIFLLFIMHRSALYNG